MQFSSNQMENCWSSRLRARCNSTNEKTSSIRGRFQRANSVPVRCEDYKNVTVRKKMMKVAIGGNLVAVVEPDVVSDKIKGILKQSNFSNCRKTVAFCSPLNSSRSLKTPQSQKIVNPEEIVEKLEEDQKSQASKPPVDHIVHQLPEQIPTFFEGDTLEPEVHSSETASPKDDEIAVEALIKRIQEMEIDNAELKSKNQVLSKTNALHQQEIEELNMKLTCNVIEMEEKNKDSLKKIAGQEEEIADLRQKHRELKKMV
jgi:hypothetical protein